MRALRAEIADRIERDIAILDALTPDPEAEPNLASPEPYSWQGQLAWATGSSDERENAECADDDGQPVVFVRLPIGRVA